MTSETHIRRIVLYVYQYSSSTAVGVGRGIFLFPSNLIGASEKAGVILGQIFCSRGHPLVILLDVL